MTQSPSLPELPKPRAQFLAMAEQCGARITGKPDGSEPIEIVFTIPAWKAFDAAHLKGYEAGSAAAAQAVPEGFVLVPREPTSKMKEAALSASREVDLADGQPAPLPDNYELWSADFVYRAMLAAAPTQGAEGAAPQAVVGEASGQTPALKRHALEAAKQLSEYAAAPFFPNVEVRGVVRSTTAEWWDGLAELIEGSQPLITRALRECTAPIAALTPSPTPTAPQEAAEATGKQALQVAQEADALREALVLAEAALSDIGDADREPGDDIAWCERRAAQDLTAIRAALAQHQPQQGEGA